MARQFFQSGARIRFFEKRGIIRYADGQLASIEMDDGTFSSSKMEALVEAYRDGNVVFLPNIEESRQRLLMREQEHQLIEFRKLFVKKLAESEYPGSIKTHKQVIKLIAARLPKDCPFELPSPSSMYRWWKDWCAYGRDDMALLPGKGVQRRKKRIPEDTLALMDDVIDEHYLKLGGYLAAKCYRLFKALFKKLNFAGKVPAIQSFYDRIHGLSPIDIVRAREGVVAARRYGRFYKTAFNPQRVCERVEIDAVHLNIGLVDDAGRYLGKVILFVAIDVYSRAIMGYAFTVAPRPAEKAETVFECLTKAVLPKLRKDYPYLGNDWPMCGKVESAVMDAGSANISSMLNARLHHLVDGREVTPTLQPWRKPFIERFFLTLRSELMRGVDGYIGSRSDTHNPDRDLKKEAKLTIREFEQKLVSYIVDTYHQSPHTGLGGWSPQQAWDEGCRLGRPELVADAGALKQLVGEEKRCDINPQYGIHTNKIRYNSGRLREIFDEGQRNPKKMRKVGVTVLASENDCSTITVIHPKTGELLSVGNIDHIPQGKRLVEYEAEQASKARPGERVCELDENDPGISRILAKHGGKTKNNAEKPRQQPKPRDLADGKLEQDELWAQLDGESIKTSDIPKSFDAQPARSPDESDDGQAESTLPESVPSSTINFWVE